MSVTPAAKNIPMGISFRASDASRVRSDAGAGTAGELLGSVGGDNMAQSLFDFLTRAERIVIAPGTVARTKRPKNR